MKILIFICCLCISSCANMDVRSDSSNVDVAVVLAARFVVSEQERATFLALAGATLEPTRKEPGCISYAFYEDPGKENSFIYFEEWKSREALASHLKQPYVKALLDAFGGLLVGDADIRVYDIESMSSGLE